MKNPIEEGQEFAAFLRTLTPEQIAEGNERSTAQATAEHAAFSSAFKRGECSLCGGRLADFDRGRPCLHWLLRPSGFTKSDFPAVTARHGYLQLQAYLRWVANEDAIGQNINDLADEGTGKLIELTIRHREYEWAFSCAQSDFDGHQTASVLSRKPHYHFQMRVKRAAFIKYNDFHIAFSKMDLINLTAMKNAPDLIRHRVLGGEGMSDLLSNETADILVRHGIAASDEANAPFKLDTLIQAEDGKTISGDALRAIMQEAKEKGVTVASLAHKLSNVTVSTIVSPGDGVVEQAPRKGGRGGKG